MPKTLQDITDRITQDYLNRPDLSPQTVRAVQAAVRHFERERFSWNETVLTLTAVATQPTLALPLDFFILDLLQVQFQGANYDMTERSFEEIKIMATAPGSNNLPTDFTIRANALNFFPIPDSAYLLNCYYLQKFPALSAMSDTNKWLSAAEDVIVYHATKLMWSNVLRNMDEATKYAALERDSAAQLYSERDQRFQTRIRPTRF